jgi:hypothetical protein
MSRRVVWALVVALAVLHQDFWAWSDPTLVGGAVPVTLAWHAGLSIVAAGVWWLVTRYAWPEDPFQGALPEPPARQPEVRG